MTEPDWARHAVWWHVYPLGLTGAEQPPPPIPQNRPAC